MSITIRRDVPASQKPLRREAGFTIPELLVSLCICLLLLQSVYQWTVLTERSNQRIGQNQQAVLLAQTVLAGAEPILPDGWAIAVEETAAGALLSAKTVEVFYEEQQWQFYYVGFDARDS